MESKNNFLLDTGHFYHNSLTKCLVCLGLLYGQNSKILVFLALTYSFQGPQKQENKSNHNSTILEAKKSKEYFSMSPFWIWISNEVSELGTKKVLYTSFDKIITNCH